MLLFGNISSSEQKITERRARVGAEFAERQTAVFDEDLKRSRRVTYEEWQNRPWTEKVSEWAESLLDSQL